MTTPSWYDWGCSLPAFKGLTAKSKRDLNAWLAEHGIHLVTDFHVREATVHAKRFKVDETGGRYLVNGEGKRHDGKTCGCECGVFCCAPAAEIVHVPLRSSMPRVEFRPSWLRRHATT